ncbi:MAG: alpha/beta fold hydrolase [Planctomycetota bacterium]|jgi:pimeloyl-ACP methyl ester carboxylesterase
MKKLLIVLVLLALVLAGCSGEDQNQVRSFDGVKISYDVQGEGEPVLVFVHGWSCSKEYWKEQVAHFAKKHKVVTIDLAGHGQSGLSRKEYTLEAFGKDVAAVAEKLNLNRIILVGHSIGGFVVVEAARQMPGRVVCVVGADEFHDIEKGFTEEDIKGLIAMIEPDFVKGTQSFVRGMFPPDADPELVDWVVSDMSSADSEIGINVFRNLGNYDLKNAIQEIEVPVYSISSDLWPMNVDGNKKYVKSFKLKMMKGIGHFVMLEDLCSSLSRRRRRGCVRERLDKNY